MFYESVHIYKFDKSNQTEEDDKDTNCAYIISVPIDGPTGVLSLVNIIQLKNIME